MLIDYGTPYMQDVSGFKVSASHFHERFGLIVIIALGEAIVATGSSLEATTLTAGVVVAALAGLVIAGRAVVGVLRRRRARRRPPVCMALKGLDRNRLARDSYGVLHGLLIAGIILVALGMKKALAHTDLPLETVPAVALCGGAALYLAGHIAFRLRNVGSLNRQRVFCALILIALIPFATSVDARRRGDCGRARPRRPHRLRG